MSMLQLNSDWNRSQAFPFSRMASNSCDNLTNSNLNFLTLTKSFKTDKSRMSTNQLQFKSAYSFSKKQPKINPTSLTHQKSLLRKTSQSHIRKSVEYEDKNVNLIKKNFSKFQEEFKNQMISKGIDNNEDPYDLLNEKETQITEETINFLKKKLELNNLTLVSSAHLNNDENGKKNGYVNKYCIVSRQGTIRGKLNHVKDSIKQLFKTPRVTNPVLNVHLNASNYQLTSQIKLNNQIDKSPNFEKKFNDKFYALYNFLARDYEKEESEKIVIYTTSLQIVRLSYDKCKRVKKILQSHCVKYEERDLYKKKEYQQELQFRLNLEEVDLPHIFFNGKYIGNCDQIESFSDQGLLKRLFTDLEKIKLKIFCEKCAGYRFILCTLCNGGKKKYNNFANLKCTYCNEDGLIRCDLCVEQQLI